MTKKMKREVATAHDLTSALLNGINSLAKCASIRKYHIRNAATNEINNDVRVTGITASVGERYLSAIHEATKIVSIARAATGNLGCLRR